jgi:hypothetical protein
MHRKLAVVTGASSGIGLAYARYFAAQGYDLIITGRRKDILFETAHEMQRNYSVDVEVIIADLSKKQDITKLLKALGHKIHIDVLVNNAGYSLNCAFTEDEFDHQIDMVKVHMNAPLLLIHSVLPGMIKNKKGIIINVSSLASAFPAANNGMYSGTKSFVRVFTESLHMEVAGYGIKIQCLCPGFTHSDFHRNSEVKDYIRPFFWMTPDQVVDYSIYCLKKGRVICIPGFLYRVINFISKFIPRKIYYPLAHRMEKYFNPAKDKVKPAWY